MELVFRLQNGGMKCSKYKVIYEPDAVFYTGALQTLKRLMRRRDCWQRVLLDCLIKHSNMMFNQSFGFLGILALPWQLFIELMGPLWLFLYVFCNEFRSLFSQSWFIYFIYVSIEFLITLYAVFLDVRKSFKKLIKEISKIFFFTILKMFVQLPIVTARLWGMASFPWRRLIW